MRRLRTGLCAAVLLTVALFFVVRHHGTAQTSSVWIPPRLTPTPIPTPLASSTASPPPASHGALTGPTEVLAPLTRVTGSSSPKSAVIRSISTKKRAVFITIDDGVTRDQRIIDLLNRTHLPVTAFLVESEVNVDPGFWQRFARAGAVVENHTQSHPHMTSLDYNGQKSQICTPQPRYGSLFGRRPTLFRPPYGLYNDTTLHAVSACGLSKTILWDATYQNGQLATWGGGLKPGDIIILHFNSSTYDDLNSLIDLIRRDGLGVGQLEGFLAPPPTPTPTKVPTPKPTPKPSPTHTPVATLPLPTPTPTPKPSPTATTSPQGTTH